MNTNERYFGCDICQVRKRELDIIETDTGYMFMCKKCQNKRKCIGCNRLADLYYPTVYFKDIKKYMCGSCYELEK